MESAFPYFVCLACPCRLLAGASSDGGDIIWGQLLVLVVLAAAVGVYMLVKSRAGRFKRHADDELIERLVERPVPHTPQRTRPISPLSFVGAFQAERRRNLKSGMELLAEDFLVSVVESRPAGTEIDDRVVEMQKMCFAELSRRSRLSALSSVALKVYILDEKAVYGKSVQCQAMSELAGRTQKDAADTALHLTHKHAV
jgi:hypothetical protein